MAKCRNEIWCWACSHCGRSGTVATATGDPVWEARRLVEADHREKCGGLAPMSRTTVYAGFNEVKPPTETYVWYCPACRCSGFVDAVDHWEADRKAAGDHDESQPLHFLPKCANAAYVQRVPREPEGEKSK